MPLYEYEHDDQFGEKCQKQFEMLQGMNDAPLDCCPDCGKPCHRIMSCFATSHSSDAVRMNPKNLERLGFTQYKRAGGGHYEKTCGDGPSVIKGDTPGGK